jgi:hypothetical protein
MGWHAILPISSMPPTQIFAPNFNDGERVVLIRYPHGGTFEIPELTVNNNHPESIRLLEGARDAVGIHHSVADRLSGADFDGDTVLVIPNNAGHVKTTPALEGLKNFDARSEYRAYEGMPKMTKQQKQTEMGSISNLITDMTLRQASTGDLARAIKHSMVVIDAQNHHLNYKQSALTNGIKDLKLKYQGSPRAGASTIISRAGATKFVPERKDRRASLGGPVNPITGRKEFELTNRTNFKTGKPRLTRTKRLAEETDAHALVSDTIGTPMERLYADHSNKLKAMANESRLAMIRTPRLEYSPSAAKTYAKEVESLNAKYRLALSNRPLERQAQAIGSANAKARHDANPNMEHETYKKIKFQALEEARIRTGAKLKRITFEPSEWDAIQAGAISDSKLDQMLNKADMDNVRALATPRQKVLMTPAKTERAADMLASGYTRAEVAAHLGVSVSTLDVATNPAAE